MPDFDYPRFRRRYRALKRNLNIAREYHTSKPSAIGTKIPIKGKHKKLNQRGTTKVSVYRITELGLEKRRFRHKEIVYTDLDKFAAVLRANQYLDYLCRRRHRPIRLDGADRVRWIAGIVGISEQEAEALIKKAVNS